MTRTRGRSRQKEHIMNSSKNGARASYSQLSFWAVCDRAIKVLVDICLVLSCAILAFMTLLGSADVISTFILDRSVPLVRELSEVLLAVVIFMSLAVVAREERHVKVDLFLRYFGPGLRRLLRIVALAISAAVVSLLAVQSTELAMASYTEGERAMASTRFPVWPAKIAVAVGLAITVLEYIRLLSRAVFTPTNVPDVLGGS